MQISVSAVLPRLLFMLQVIPSHYFLSNLTKLYRIDPLVITASHTDANCSGGDGMITLSASGGTGAITIIDQDTNDIYSVGNTNVPVGTYNLILTDANQCVSNVVTVNVTAPGMSFPSFFCPHFSTLPLLPPLLSYLKPHTTPTHLLYMVDPLVITANHTDASCSGGNGTITLSVSGGTGERMITDQNTNAIYTMGNNSVPEGTYNLIVTDVNQCVSNVATIMVAAPGIFIHLFPIYSFHSSYL